MAVEANSGSGRKKRSQGDPAKAGEHKGSLHFGMDGLKCGISTSAIGWIWAMGTTSEEGLAYVV